MEFDTTESKIFCCKTSDAKTAILPVETSMILPDYYPDVMKILRYKANIVSFPTVPEDGGETVSGNVRIEVNYLSENGELCCCTQLQPYRHTFPVEGQIVAQEGDAVVTEVACRAVSKRRIDVHGVLNLELKTLSAEEKTFLAGVEGNGFVSKGENVGYTLVCGEYYKTFTMEEEGEAGYGKPAFGNILRTEAHAELNECHVIQDKIVTKGEVLVRALWTAETEEEDKAFYTSDFRFPVSRMLEADGVGTGDICDARFVTDFPEIEPSEDGSTLKIKVKIGIFARVYRKNDLDYLTDAFSTAYESKTERGEFSVISGAIPVEMRENIYDQIENTDGEEVVDFWVETDQKPTIGPERKICYSVRLCLFLKNENGEISYREKVMDRTLDLSVTEQEIGFYNLSAVILSEEFRQTRGGNTELSAEILVDGTVYTENHFNALLSCCADGDKQLERSSVALVFYYAEAGENIWEIAKAHRTSYDRILMENDLAYDILSEPKMLVIPKE